jgi:type IX secretion system PorP/SprF family membrane protein
MAGYYFKIGETFAIEPSFLIKKPVTSKALFELNSKVYYKDLYWGGLSYRTRNAFIVYLGAKFSRYYIGYAFDYNFSELGRQTYGSHEFMAAVKFGDTARRYRWLNTY